MTRLLLLVLLLPTQAWAQTVIESYELQIYAPGVDPAILTNLPIQTTAIPAASATCGLDAPPLDPTLVINPVFVWWDNTPNGLGWCQADRAAFFGGLPNANGYRAVITATNVAGTSPRSPGSDPFARQSAPAAPAAVRLTR
mgnify:CR=1 FL=1